MNTHRSKSGPEPPLHRALDRLMARYDRADAPGATVAVLRRGVVELARAWGAARLGPGVPVPATPGTRFRLASLTKQLTAKVIALLVEDGTVSLDTPAAAVLPALPAWGEEVRIGHLVAHTAGLPDYEALIPDGRTTPVTDREVVELLARAPALEFPPGSRFAYSNGGYALLATVVEELAGRSFTDVLEDRIFRPLGMAGAVAHVEGRTVVRRRAYGFRREGAAWVDADQGVTTAVLGDGGVYASVLELATWDSALYRPGYQPPPAALAPYAVDGPAAPGGLRDGPAAGLREGPGYGFGWYLDRFRGHRRQRHDGWSSGFQNEIQRFPDAGLTVVVLTNRASPPVRPLVEAIAMPLLPAP